MGYAQSVSFSMPTDEVAEVNSKAEDYENRSEAIRALVLYGLKHASEDELEEVLEDASSEE